MYGTLTIQKKKNIVSPFSTFRSYNNPFNHKAYLIALVATIYLDSIVDKATIGYT